MASRALTPRLVITCSSCPGSAITGPERGIEIEPERDVLADDPAQQAAISVHDVLRFTQPGLQDLLAAEREELAGQRRGAVRRAADLGHVQPARGRASSSPASSSSALPRIAVSRLLKSWAIPPASCPTASIFCA